MDFDSTFVQLEAVKQLAQISLSQNPKKEKIAAKIEHITNLAMDGKLTFQESLKKRLALFKPTKKDIQTLVTLLETSITPSIARNEIFFKEHRNNIYIISGGFVEFIAPIVAKFGIAKNHVLANTFVFDKKGVATGYDKKNPLAGKGGKTEVIKKLNLNGNVIMIGDGYTDYIPRADGVVDTFIAFTENVRRDVVVAKADHVVRNLDEFLYLYNFHGSLSYPKSKMKVLLLENISDSAIEQFKKEGFSVETIKKALNEDELADAIKNVSILGIRSKTEVTPKVLSHARKLLAIGAFCIGTNQIALSDAAKKGIAVFNAPYSNTRSVVELVMGEIIMLYRKTFEKSTKMHAGIWDKSANNSHEVRGKKLGIVGYGNIGTQLSILAESLGMHVYFYDIAEKLSLGNATRCESLEELLAAVDVVTIHVDGRKSNANLIGQREFSVMKNGVLFLNLSRGHIVDIDALTQAIKNGKVAGAAVDVYPQEPKSNSDPFVSPLRDLPNVILTPHIGGSTEEAQHNIGEFVTHKLITFINTGSTTLSVNFPDLTLPLQVNA
ncbi:MAG: phosphoglycerate dehydrogenase, partial [Candidatus Levyibacteriota bacterium]